MTAPVIYDIASDSFRPVTQAEVNAMITRLNGRAPIMPPVYGPNNIASHPISNVWSTDATRAAR